MTTTPRTGTRWLLRRPTPDAPARIFCFPYSGIGASMFNRWPRFLGGAEICPIQPPARENRSREPHFGTYQHLAAGVVEAIEPYLDRPFLFVGHCTGALPAYETAVRLATLGLPAPAWLVVSAQVAPHHCPYDRFLDLSEQELTDELAELVGQRGAQPDPMLIELALRVLRLDLGASRVYRREEPVRLPAAVAVVRWTDDPEVTDAQLRPWQEYASEVRFVDLPGGHYDILDAPAALRELLAGLAATTDGTR
ncbi:thioesterase [Micromonospora fluostatini]|uniref:Thioesterase n=1 Tax=Micromonospora fluostatini TaxID=1629071 RepID=A0ABY2DEZ9_9ACTN|nr:thioesterase [Micromonospora fluostatini]